MKVSVNWLNDYIEIDKTPEELADDLSFFGHQAESVEKVGDDTVLDLEITANRGDCLSILGIAREVAALYNLKLRTPEAKVSAEKLDKKIEVKIEKPEICHRFTARIIDNIQIAESSKEIQERLATYGFRPINNIVDITNYVMVATGQPLHAFDYDKIKGGLMKIHEAKEGEEVMTLDGQNRILNNGAVIIEDEEKIYDLAGIMGGLKSEVDENTKTIVLQGAIFDPIVIRRASKYLNHSTDASYRYERGVDYEGTVSGVDTAASLIKESCPDAIIGELIDIKSQPLKLEEIEINLDKINKLLGTDVSMDSAQEFLTRLGFKLNGNKVSVPSYRAYDIKIWQDLAEEIARMYGYNKIEKEIITEIGAQANQGEFQKRESLKDLLKEIGFTESYSYSFADREKLELLGEKINECVEIANPLSPETQYLRPSLLLALLNAVAKNPWAPEVNVFEIEKVFSQEKESWQLGLASTGKKDDLLKEACEKLGLKEEIVKVEQKILDYYKIRRPVSYLLAEVDKVEIKVKEYSSKISRNKYRPVSRYAPTVRDLAFLVPEDVKSDEIIGKILEIDPKILLVELFDEYTSDKFGVGQKNLAFHIWLENIKGPLAEKDAEELINRIISQIEELFKAKLRSR